MAGTVHELTDPLGREVRVLTPDGWHAGEQLPMLLLLHGAMSSARALDLYQPLIEELWAERVLPPVVVGCMTTPTSGGFYIDWPSGARWESAISDDLPALLATRFGGDPGVIALLGASMGGYGVLKLAFARPERYVAAAAVAPVVFAGSTGAEVPAEQRPGVLGELLATIAELPGESLEVRAREHAAQLQETGLPIFVAVGGRDEFHLHVGVSHLHHRMIGLGISHEYELRADAGHADEGAEALLRSAVEFVAAILMDRSTLL